MSTYAEIRKKKRRERVEAIIRILSNIDEPISRQHLHDELRYPMYIKGSRRTIQRVLRNLIDKGLVQMHSQGRGAKYKLSEEAQKEFDDIREEFKQERFQWARYSPSLNNFPSLMPAEKDLLTDYLMGVRRRRKKRDKVAGADEQSDEPSVREAIRLTARAVLRSMLRRTDA